MCQLFLRKFTNFLAYKNKTPPSCYLDGATEIILLKLIFAISVVVRPGRQ